MEAGGWCAGLDVADGGGDRNALVRRVCGLVGEGMAQPRPFAI
jgi:hypothetical protein